MSVLEVFTGISISIGIGLLIFMLVNVISSGLTWNWQLAITGQPYKSQRVWWVNRRIFGIPFFTEPLPQAVFWLGSSPEQEERVAKYLYSKNKKSFFSPTPDQYKEFCVLRVKNSNLKIWPSKEIAEGVGATGFDDWYPNKYINIIC